MHGPTLRKHKPDINSSICDVGKILKEEPEELAESLVVGDGFVIVLREGVLDVLEAPLLHQLTRRLGFLQDEKEERKDLWNRYF